MRAQRGATTQARVDTHPGHAPARLRWSLSAVLIAAGIAVAPASAWVSPASAGALAGVQDPGHRVAVDAATQDVTRIESRGTQHPSTPTGGTVVVFLAGMTSSWPLANDTGTFWGPDGMATRLRQTDGFSPSALLNFSYSGAASATFGHAYTACDTLRHLGDSEAILDRELTAYAASHANVDIYLVGHSQGGVLALGYLAWLATQPGRSLSAPIPGAHLAGMVTLDSPLGGLSLPRISFGGVSVDLKAAAQAYILTQCAGAGAVAPDLADFVSLGGQARAAPGWPWGTTGSIEKLYGVPSPRDNQVLATEAGVRVLTVGNTLDRIMTPSGFGSTQWLGDAASAGIFSRVVNIASSCAANDIVCMLSLNHGAVLTSAAVHDAVVAFMRGGTPGLPVPESPYTAAASAVWNAAGGDLTAANGLIRLSAATGSIASPGQASLTSVPMSSIADPLPAGHAVAGPAVSVALPALTPGATVSLTLPVNVSAPGSSTTAVFRDGAWVPVPTTLDLAVGTATATITEGGVYAPLMVLPASVALSDSIGAGIRRGSTGFTAGPITVRAGSWVTYRVVARPRLAGRIVTIWSRPGTGAWRKVATRNVATDGTIHYYAKVRTRTAFRATWAGDETYAPAASHGRTVSTR